MKTREELYGEEAAEILRIITTYQYIRKDQLQKLFVGKETKTDNLLSYLTKQGRIKYIPESDIYTDGGSSAPSIESLSAIWVLIDFIDKVDYHSASDFPVSLIFTADSEMYEVIYVSHEREAVITHLLSEMKSSTDKRIVIVEDISQIGRLNIPDVTAYCTVNTDTGQINYYKQSKENDIG